MTEIEPWSPARSYSLYGLGNWGQGYVGINDKGNLTIFPNGPEGAEIDLFQLVEDVKARGIDLPVLFRFNGILRHRLQVMAEAFASAIAEHNYQGRYFPAFPIKVNQQRHIVDVLRKAGRKYSMGLEVGSKPELIAVLGIHDDPEALLLCNGYKDRDYIELALMSQKVGRNPVIIVEKLSELPLTLDVAEELGIRPNIAFRLRLTGRGSGRWEKSGGDRAKFGLTVSDIVEALSILEQRNALDCLKLLHFHSGSQLTSISALRNSLREATQVYVQLKKRCENLTYLDIGGGLGVDYDGSKTNFESSMNYSLEEYARDVIWMIQEVCREAGVADPHVVTEAGRAMTAYHSVLVFNTLGLANRFTDKCDAREVIEAAGDSIVKSLGEALNDLSPKNCQETLHDAIALRNELLQKFNMGMVTIEDRALADRCFWALLNEICSKTGELNYVPEDLEALPGQLTDTYFCNLSVFQSIPDSWAIKQIFPIAPVHRHREKPERRVVIGDITCDSDGKIDRFPDLRDVNRYLLAHDLVDGEEYYFATFLVGAYQEILGDLHNLFGDTNAVHVEVQDGEISLSNVVRGDSVGEVLNYVQYDRGSLLESWRQAVERSVRCGDITPSESAEIMRKYSQAFDGYTYLSA